MNILHPVFLESVRKENRFPFCSCDAAEVGCHDQQLFAFTRAPPQGLSYAVLSSPDHDDMHVSYHTDSVSKSRPFFEDSNLLIVDGSGVSGPVRQLTYS